MILHSGVTLIKFDLYQSSNPVHLVGLNSANTSFRVIRGHRFNQFRQPVFRRNTASVNTMISPFAARMPRFLAEDWPRWGWRITWAENSFAILADLSREPSSTTIISSPLPSWERIDSRQVSRVFSPSWTGMIIDRGGLISKVLLRIHARIPD